MRILVKRNGEEDWRTVEPDHYGNEAELQELLAECPSLIPLEEVGEGLGEMVVAVREFGLPGSGSTDIVGFTAAGEVVLIECKLASNQEIKRKVVGQILEYAAFLWQTDYEDVDRRVRAQHSGKGLVELIGEVGGDDWDPDVFREAVEQNLEEGSFYLVIAVDRINDELARIIKYINQSEGQPFSLHALEMRRFQGHEEEVLVPRLHGEEGSKREKKRTSRRRTWDEESFFQEAKSNLSSEEVHALRELYEWARNEADELSWGTGPRNGSFTYKVVKEGNPYSVFAAFTNGEIRVRQGDGTWWSQRS
jgi:hypothetical protein